MKKVILIATLALSGNIFAGVPFIDPVPAPLTLEEAYEELKVLNEADLSCQVDADCIAIATGSRPCGGPSGYIVASQLNPAYQDGTLNGLATLTEELEGELSEELGLISICLYEMPPEVACQADFCGVKSR